MASAGALASRVVRAVLDHAEPGVTTQGLSDLARRLIDEGDAIGLFRGYSQGEAPPFPGDLCVSVNDEIVHGVPSGRVLERGDLLSVDCGLRLDGWCADHASSVVVGGDDANPVAARLIAAAWGVLDRAITEMTQGSRWSTVARAMEEATEATGFGLVTDFVGHGIGTELHEAPKAPCYWSGTTCPDFTLTPGLVLAVEPLLTVSRGGAPGSGASGLPAWRTGVRTDEQDAWTVRTADGSLACHVEHTVAITDSGPRVLTA